MLTTYFHTRSEMLFRLFLCLAWMPIALAVNRFISPPDALFTEDYRDNPIYQINDSITLKWMTDEKVANLTYWVYPTSRSNPAVSIARNISDKSYEWKLTPPYSSNINDELERVGHIVVYFSLQLYSSFHMRDSILTKSHSINITALAPAKSSSISSTIIPSSTSIMSSSTTEIPPVATAPPPPDTPTDDKPSAGVIGGAAGGAIGGLFIIGVIGFVLWRRYRKPAPKLTARESAAFYDMPVVAETSPKK